MKVRKAVIVAAGRGTRFLPFTKSVPKEMLPLVDKPVIQYAVEEAVDCGMELVIMVTSPEKVALEDYFGKNAELEHVLQQKGKNDLLEKICHLPDLANICFVHQKEQRGLGDAVLSARAVVGEEPFALILPDDLFEERELALQNMLHIFQEYQGSVIAVKQVGKDEIERYGVITPKKIKENIYQVVDLVEKPKPERSPSNLAVMGRYVLTHQIFEELASTPSGVGGEIQLTDALRRLLTRQHIYSYEIQGEYYDSGTIPGWIQATLTLALKHPQMGPHLRSYLNHLLQ
ncbi:MAG: UTP--glucose-1-phosphate uridylyltransferase GalU [Chloroflexota bacterium]|nr:UTP--glucose-1-phosphate uridylyltransferase GalU [Chloroflexota bacterium]